MIKVIIVEDDYRIAGIHEEFLNKISNITVTGKALNGNEAIKQVAATHVDLVLLDIYMPDILGTDIIQELRTINPDIDIIMISAATEADIVKEAIRNGVFDYIIKPVKMERFIETIERYKNVKKRLDAEEDVDQSFLDEYFGHKTDAIPHEKQTPKGIDPLTLEKVKEIINRIDEGITAEEMGTRIGASRTTARRYLEYLISVGTITAELEYGVVGRPERRYHKK
ncbi:DNA-binding response regulator [Virgibacillus profundi]|uniref:DNA-binding response regulator n=1 Tax=Virgibacillus profundi TaxID=2024555 RepID=A0A2A2IIG0_9BACI|nr:response regulator [Virgibacillus profundi]PAV30930.1 DNA-binding response regulator [Virgibacillus profundi]PXY55115.1 DNA-binding response regulator [Virgibacillus profundi]